MTRHALSWRDDHLGEAVLGRIMEAVTEHPARRDALAPLGLPVDGQDRVSMQMRMSDLLDGHDEEASARAIDAVSERPYRIEASALAMLRATGMDAAVMILVAHALSRSPEGGWTNVRLPAYRLTAGPARHEEALVSVEQDDRIFVRAPFAAQTSWTTGGEIFIGRAIPENVCIAMEGRRLGDVVTHPTLDPLDLSIVDVKPSLSPVGITIRTDKPADDLRMGDLTLENTRPDRRTLNTPTPRQRKVDLKPTF